jgi:hypothetical protein
MDMAQQSSLKFKFPAHIISLVVRTTGCRLGRDKLVAIGAAFVKVPNPRTQVQILEKKTFQFEVDADEPLDANFMSAEELKQLQGEAKPTAQAVAQVVAFVKECMRQDHDSFIAAQNPVSMLTLASRDHMLALGVCHTMLTLAFSPTALGPADLPADLPCDLATHLCVCLQMVELGMLELAAAEHCAGFITLSHLAEEAGGGNQGRAPIDLGSLACGLVSTDSKQGNGKSNMGKPARNGVPWATLSEYLQLQNPGYDARPESRPPVPSPNPNGRLDPHDEAVDKGWHFGNVSRERPLVLHVRCRLRSRTGCSSSLTGLSSVGP